MNESTLLFWLCQFYVEFRRKPGESVTHESVGTTTGFSCGTIPVEDATSHKFIQGMSVNWLCDFLVVF